MNDTATDPITGLPFSSRHVAEYLRRGAERFGWSKRSMAPQMIRAADGSCAPMLSSTELSRISSGR
jgi:xanthine dehydrogenase YagR molybdenum-binding subunit